MKERIDFLIRLIFGLIFTIFGSNGLMMIVSGTGFIPLPPAEPEMARFMGALFASGYLMPLVKGLEVFAGVLLLIGCYVPLALIMLGPILVNILCSHLFLDISAAPMGIVLTFMYLRIMANYWASFRPLFVK